MHALLFGQFRGLESTRGPWCSDLALGRRPVSAGRRRYAGRWLFVSWGVFRMASRRDSLLSVKTERSDLTGKGTEGYARISDRAEYGSGSRGESAYPC